MQSPWVIHEIKAHSQPIAGLAFHPSSTQLATRSVDGTLKLWETNTWQNLLTRSLAGTSQHDRHDPVFSQDGRFLVADRDGEQLKLIRTQRPSNRQQSPDADYDSTRAYALIEQQRWPEAFEGFEKALTKGSDDLSVQVHAAEVAAMLEPTASARKAITEAARRGHEIADQDLKLAGRLILPAQLVPGADPDPERTLRIV